MDKFLEIFKGKNKIVTILPCFLGTVVARYRYQRINIENLLLYVMIIILFDSGIRLLKERDKEIESCRREKIKQMILIIFFLLSAMILGIYLGVRTSCFVLLLECIGFICGVSYCKGPMPIKRTPFAEFIYALTKGMILPFIALYIHLYDMKKIYIDISSNYFAIYTDYFFILEFLILFLPCFGTIFNIALANNMCTMREDLKNKKFTLPISIGKRKSYKLYKNVYRYIYICIIIGVLFKVITPLAMVFIISVKYIKINNKKLRSIKNKKEANILAVKNFLIINVLYILIMLI